MPQEFSRLARLFTALGGFALLAACGGGGNGGGGVTVSGKITFDRLQFQPTVGNGLNAASAVESPAREVMVEAVANGSAVATTITDSNGDYSFSVPANTNMFIRARARMEKTGSAPTWSFTVRNNTNSDAVYALQGASFNSGTANLTRNLRAASGWGGNSYTGTRAAAPFAILDTVYRTKQLILSAAPTVDFVELDLYWSTENRPALSRPDDPPCPPEDPSCAPDIPICPDAGNIGTSFYFRDSSGTTRDRCDTPAVLPNGIYILGDYANGAGDTDEFDSHVIAHEFGHYFEDRFSRSDSLGGEHSFGDRLDPRVAFGEGWGNAFGAMALNDPEYRDSFDGVDRDSGFDFESDATLNEGWFSEFSVGEILWDLFDDNAAAPESGDNAALGFGPIFAVMTDEQVDTDAFTSIFSFATALRGQSGVSGSAVTGLLNGENINGNDEFAMGEANNGGDARALPVYDQIFLNTPKSGVCSSSAAGSEGRNKLANHRFLRFDNDVSRLVTISVQGAAPTPITTVPATNPDVLVFRRGSLVLVGDSNVAGQETIDQQQLPAGTYILDVYDVDLTGTNEPARCMAVSITGS